MPGIETLKPPIEELESEEEIANKDFDSSITPASAEMLIESSENDLQQKEITPQQAQRVIDQIESIPQYQSYQRQRVRIDTLESLVNDFDVQNPNYKKSSSPRETRRDLVDFIDDIKKNIDSYFEILLQISRQGDDKVRRFYKDDRELAEEAAALDQLRRFTHNALTSELRGLYRFVTENIKNDPARGISAEGKLFNLNELTDQNRSMIGSWAYNTAMGSRLEKTVQQAKKITEKEEATT